MIGWIYLVFGVLYVTINHKDVRNSLRSLRGDLISVVLILAIVMLVWPICFAIDTYAMFKKTKTK